MGKLKWILAALALVSAPAARGVAADQTFDRTLPLPAGGSVVLENVTGSVTVVGWDREAVEIHAVKSARSAADLDRVRIDAGAATGRVAVNTVYPANESVEVTVNYTLRVPRRVWLAEVATVNGTVRVSGVDGAGDLRSVNGDVDVADSSGGFSAQSTNGNIHMEVARLVSAGPLRIGTVNGSIELALPPSASAALNVRCWSGDFHSAIPLAVVGAYQPREFHGRLGSGGTALELHTVNGGIRILALPQGV